MWLGLQQSVTTEGAANHWDRWYGTCNSGLRRWQAGQPADDAYDPATQTMTPGAGDNNCAILGFGGLPVWYDTICAMQAACVCERPQNAWSHRRRPCRRPLRLRPSRCRRTRIAPPAGSNSRRPLFSAAGVVPATPAIPAKTKCYKALDATNSAEGCGLQCKVEGGDSVCIESLAENDFVTEYVLGGRHSGNRGNCNIETQVGCGWIGLYQDVTTGGSAANWDTWRSGCTTTFTNWNAGMPGDFGRGGRGTGDDNCAFIGWNGGGKWSDAPCYMRSTCICEKPVTTAPAPTPSGGLPPTTPVNNEALNQNTNSGGGMGAGGIVLIIFNVILVTMIGGLVYVFVIKPRRQPASRSNFYGGSSTMPMPGLPRPGESPMRGLAGADSAAGNL